MWLITAIILLITSIITLLVDFAVLSVAQFLYIDNPNWEMKSYFKSAKIINKYHYYDNFKLCLSFLPWIASCYFVLPMFYVVPYFTESLATSAKWLIKLYKDGKIV